MTWTSIDVDDSALEAVMVRYRLTTKSEAVNFALCAIAAEPLSFERARDICGSGWDGDLDSIREARTG